MILRHTWRRAALLLGTVALAPLIGVLPALAAQQHTIQAGETLYGIAAAYGVSVDALAAANGIANINLIYAGEQLVIPGTESQAPVAEPVAVVATQPAEGSHTIAPGETLMGIALNYGLTLDALLAANPGITNPNMIYAGETIVIPGLGGAQPVVAATSRDQIAWMLAEQAAVYGLDPALVQALAWQESGWQQHVVSSSGAVGVMQVLPDTASWVAQSLVGRPLDLTVPSDNIVAGVAYLRWLIDHTGSIERGLAAYYQGPGAVQRYGIYPETQQYVQNILAIRDYIAQFGGPPLLA